MEVTILPYPCARGATLPLVSSAIPFAHSLLNGPKHMDTGARLSSPARDSEIFFEVAAHAWLPFHGHCAQNPGQMQAAAFLTALKDIQTNEPLILALHKEGYSAAVITLSDKGYMGMRADTAGPLCMTMLQEALPVEYGKLFLIPDDPSQLRGLMANLTCIQKYDLVITCGGTGLGPRDITPQVTASLLDLELPGFCQAMMGASLAITPHAAISRAHAGVIDQSLVINLPGSAKAVQENLAPLLPILAHALAKLKGDTSDCAETIRAACGSTPN